MDEVITVRWFGRPVKLHRDTPTIRYDSPDPDSYCGGNIELTPSRKLRGRPQTWHGSYSKETPYGHAAVTADGPDPQKVVSQLQRNLRRLHKVLGKAFE